MVNTAEELDVSLVPAKKTLEYAFKYEEKHKGCVLQK